MRIRLSLSFGNRPYYKDYLADLGYSPTYPLWCFTVDLTSPQYQAAKRRGCQHDKRRCPPHRQTTLGYELETLQGVFNETFNETFKDEWEFQPLTIAEFHEFFDTLKPILDPHQILIGEVSGQTARFRLGMPDWTPLFRSFKGRVGLLQGIRLMFTAGRYRRAGLLGIGALPAYRGTGLARALAVALYRRYEDRGFKGAFYYPVNEGNTRSRKFAESLVALAVCLRIATTSGSVKRLLPLVPRVARSAHRLRRRCFLMQFKWARRIKGICSQPKQGWSCRALFVVSG